MTELTDNNPCENKILIMYVLICVGRKGVILVSVIIPVYNRASIIKTTIDNILEQSYSDIEIIVVDDGSTDNIKDIMASYQKDKVSFISYGSNKGACYARNVGINNSKGEYIAFQDSDDYWYPEKIQHQLDYLEKTNADICICGMKQIYENGKIKFFHAKNFSDKDITVENELGHSFISTQLLFGKRSCFLEEQFDETFPRFQDWDLGIRLVMRYKMVFLDEILVKRYLQANSVSNNHKKGYIAGKLLYEKYNDEYLKYPKAESKFLTFYAKLQELNGESSHENLKRALKLDFNLRTWAKYISQLFGIYQIFIGRL